MTAQYELDFSPGLTHQYRTLKQVCAAAVYGFRGGLNAVAAACDVSPSTLSRMLNEQDHEENKRHLPADFVPIIVGETGDHRPIFWLVEKFIPDDDTRRKAAIRRAEALLDEFPQLIDALKG